MVAFLCVVIFRIFYSFFFFFSLLVSEWPGLIKIFFEGITIVYFLENKMVVTS